MFPGSPAFCCILYIYVVNVRYATKKLGRSLGTRLILDAIQEPITHQPTCCCSIGSAKPDTDRDCAGSILHQGEPCQATTLIHSATPSRFKTYDNTWKGNITSIKRDFTTYRIAGKFCRYKFSRIFEKPALTNFRNF